MERKKKNEEKCVYCNLDSGTSDCLWCDGNEASEFHGERAAEARNRGGEDRQLQLRARNAYSAGGDCGHLDQSRRHSPYGRQHGRCVQVQSARHGWKVLFHLQQGRIVSVLLL